MNATENDIVLLEKLQEVDRKVTSAEKEFKELPHRQAILEVRKKKEEVLAKKVQVQDMLDEAEFRLNDLVSEDDSLSVKQAEIEKTLQEVQGDYRAVNAHTRELDGVRKRRDKVALELSRVEEQLNKINPVLKQVMEGLTGLEAKEADLIKSFQETGTALQKVIAEGSAARGVLAQGVSSDLLASYEQTRKHCGGVALSHLRGNSCSVCRNTFEQGKLLTLRAQAPIATCPSCGRLLIVHEGD